MRRVLFLLSIVGCGGNPPAIADASMEAGVESDATMNDPDAPVADAGSDADASLPNRLVGIAAVPTGGSPWVDDMAIAPNGDVVIVGGYSGTGLVFGNTTLPSTQGMWAAGFVARFIGQSDKIAWAKPIAGTTSSAGSGVAIDPSGDVFVGGAGDHTISVGGMTYTAVNTTSRMVARLDGATGTAKWLRGMSDVALADGGGSTSSLSDPHISLAMRGSTLVMVTGTSDGLRFVRSDLSTFDVASDDTFCAKLDPATGDPTAWAALGSKGLVGWAGSVDLLPSLDILVGGYRWGGTNLYGALVARIASSDFHVVWQKGFGETIAGSAETTSVRSTASGDAIAGGMFSKEVDFGKGMASSNGEWDGFALRLDGASGDTTWQKTYGGVHTEGVVAVTEPAVLGTLASQNVSIDGVLLPKLVSTTTAAALASWDSMGTLRWAGAITPNPGAIAPEAAREAANGNMVFAGTFRGDVDFGSGQPYSPQPAGNAIFVAEWK